MRDCTSSNCFPSVATRSPSAAPSAMIAVASSPFAFACPTCFAKALRFACRSSVSFWIRLRCSLDGAERILGRT